jgi:hypothetical protein
MLPPPSIVNFINRYLGALETSNSAQTRSYPQARPISSKGKGLVDIHSEITASVTITPRMTLDSAVMTTRAEMYH